jgi:REP element-mobilizing transposase RayT
VLNRGVGRRTLFDEDQDFLAFERVVEEALRTCAMWLCAYCLMSNHWHFVVWPEHDGDLRAFMQQMTFRRSGLGCPDGEAIEPRIDAPVAWKAEEGAVGTSNRYHYPHYLYTPDLVAVTFSSS